jgi:hypothetical protein
VHLGASFLGGKVLGTLPEWMNKDGRQSYNTEPEYRDQSAVQIAGYGKLNWTEAEILTREEK